MLLYRDRHIALKKRGIVMNRLVAHLFASVINFAHAVFFIFIAAGFYQVWYKTNDVLDQVSSFVGYDLSTLTDDKIKLILSLMLFGIIIGYSMIFGVISMFIHMSETLEKIEQNTRSE